MEGGEQNKSEEATPFKLRRAREKGQVARGMDLGFVGTLLALAIFMFVAGENFFGTLSALMRILIVTGIDQSRDPNAAVSTITSVYWIAFKPLFVLGATIVILLVFLELLQLRGFIFSAQPLKPDFNRLNPAKGLKRIFSMRTIKETLKNIVKMAVYATAAWLLISGAIWTFGKTFYDADRVVGAMESAATRMLLTFIGIAFCFMVIDQIIVRKEFRKQMRMSRSELQRETKEQDGDPRFKQRRKTLHAEMMKQSQGLGRIAGSDFLITNPDHYAIALEYNPDAMDAPLVRAKGRNHFAQLMKRKARLLNIPIVEDRRLAQAIFRDCDAQSPILAQHFHDVAKLYIKLRNRDEARI